jgi:hypothetical protein
MSGSREKMLHAIVFFVQGTRPCGEVKLWRLLYLLDFGIYRQTGRSVTGLSYSRAAGGPGPGRARW